jgi:2-polyprenyl-3-methyl-5-hydroxy-6-metoxy-1,4-benzoquinol methylase
MEWLPHKVDWTRDKSARFWDFLSNSNYGEETYFSAMVGDALIGVVKAAGVSLEGRTLDFGCGPGHLIGKLLSNGVTVEGVDFSSSSIEQVNDRFGSEQRFNGAHRIDSIPSSLPDEVYETVFLIETIEHLMDKDLDATISEIRRILKPGGVLIISTPNDENLALNETICPDCGAIFHRVQHVRSWSGRSLEQAMKSRGFETVAIKRLYLQSSRWRSILFTRAASLLRKKQPHLIYIGRRE